MSLMTGHRGTAALAGAVLLGSLGLAGCSAGHSAGHAIRKILHPVAGNHTVASVAVAGGEGIIDALIARLQAGAATSFEATYMSAGKVTAEIVYAVRPPGGLVFSETALSRKIRRTKIVVNGSGEYMCKSSGHPRWTCQQLGPASAAAQNKTFGLYTAQHWAAYLKTVALAAGGKVTTFTGLVRVSPMIGKGALDDGMSCISFRPAGAAVGFAGIRTICAAAPGILGSVIGCTGPFIVLGWYTTSPPASLFQLPHGAKVTNLKSAKR